MKTFSLLIMMIFLVGCSLRAPVEPRKIVTVDVQEITVKEPCNPPEVICDLSITVKGTREDEDKEVISKMTACISEQKRALYVCSKEALDAALLKNMLNKKEAK